jgi:formamidopyrimidine-DNA glycosylase
MPELPEVETIAEYLRRGKEGPSLIGQSIRAVDVQWNRTIAEPDLLEFHQRIRGQSVQEIGRRAKFLKIGLSQDTLLVHLRMSGDLRMEPEVDPDGQERAAAAHDRVLFHLESGWRLAFNDARKFGRVWLVRDPASVLDGLGPEPLDEAFTPAVLAELLQGRSRQLKPLLLDQTFLAGLGNIYTDEALHRARLHPNQPADRLAPEQVERLWQAIRAVLLDGIRSHGASIDWAYRGGDFQNRFQVYGRTGERCYQCGTLIVRRVVGQRSTHFCPTCQPEPL